jgi:type II secretory pathway pseudopilin PulG
MSRCPTVSLSRSPGPAFTLLELILVVVIIAVLAGAIAPRITGTDTRRAEQEAGQVQALLTAAAQRDAHSTEPLAITFDGADGRLALTVQRAPDPASGAAAAWTIDPAAPTVKLDLLEIREASLDGQRLPERAWRVEFPRTEPRPNLTLLLAMKGRTDAGPWRIELPPSATAAVQSSGSAAQSASPRTAHPIDLDAAGRGDEPW